MKKRKTRTSKKKDTEFLRAIIVRIKELREHKKIPQEHFYEETRINIGRIERGASDFNMTTLKKICGYFEITPSEFFKGMK